MGTYLLNASLVASPPVNGVYKIYFADRAETVSLSQQQWQSLLDQSRKQRLISRASLASNVDYPLTPHDNLDDYWQWLITSGLLVPFQADVSNEPGQVRIDHLSSQKRSRREPVRLNLQPLFQRIPLDTAKNILTWQLLAWPFLVALFIFVFFAFYFGSNSPWHALAAAHLDPISSAVRILLMFLVVNLSSVFATVILKRAVGYSDYNLDFILKWGLFPAFTTRLNYRRVHSLCSQREGSLLYAQPMLIRAYLCTLSMLVLFPASTFLASWPPALIIFTRTLQQATMLGLLIDCLPILNNSLIRFLIFNHLLQPNYLQASFAAFRHNCEAILEGNFKRITRKRLSLLFSVSLLAVTLKVAFIYTRILPGLAGDLPPIFGQFTSDLAKLALIVILFRFCYLRLFPRLLGSTSATPAASSDLQISQSYPHQSLSLPAQQTSLRRINSVWLRTNKARFAILLVILFFPFHSSIAGVSTVVEGKSVELRTTNPGRVAQVYHDGPSDSVLVMGTPLIRIQSDSLDASLATNREDIAAARSQEKRVRSDLQSLQDGAKYQSLSDLDDELISTSAQLMEHRKSLASLRQQIKLSEETVKAYRELSALGAVSRVQLRTLEIESLSLRDSYSQTAEKVKQLSAQVRIAQRSKMLGQGLGRNEELIKLDENLAQSRALLAKSLAIQSKLENDRKSLTISMPFNGVISSSTRELLHRSVSSGETLVTIKSVPLTSIRVLVPEYDRHRLRDGLRTVVRLYADSMSEFAGTITNVNPETVQDNGADYAEASVMIGVKLPDNFVGSKGTAKIVTSTSCLAAEIIRPVSMFIRIDIWKYLPWA